MEAVNSPLDDLNLVIDPLEFPGMNRMIAVIKDPAPMERMEVFHRHKIKDDLGYFCIIPNDARARSILSCILLSIR